MWIISYLNKNKLLCVDHSPLCIVIAVSLLYNPRVQSRVLQLQIKRMNNYEPKLTQASLVQQAMDIFWGFYFRQSSTFSFDGKHEGFTSFHPPVIGAIGAMNILKETANLLYGSCLMQHIVGTHGFSKVLEWDLLLICGLLQLGFHYYESQT